jgi:hypothetical protein
MIRIKERNWYSVLDAGSLVVADPTTILGYFKDEFATERNLAERNPETHKTDPKSVIYIDRSDGGKTYLCSEEFIKKLKNRFGNRKEPAEKGGQAAELPWYYEI